MRCRLLRARHRVEGIDGDARTHSTPGHDRVRQPRGDLRRRRMRPRRQPSHRSQDRRGQDAVFTNLREVRDLDNVGLGAQVPAAFRAISATFTQLLHPGPNTLIEIISFSIKVQFLSLAYRASSLA